MLRLQGRGRRDDKQVRFDGPPARWLSHTIVVLANRERWTCHICELPVARGCPPDHHAAPTRDHVVPRYHERGLGDNVKLAHKWCNSERQDLPMVCVDRDLYRRRLLILVPELRRAA